MLKTYHNSVSSNERGFSTIQWLFILIISIVLGQLTVKIVPVYVESYSVVGLLKQMARQENLTEFSANEIRRIINKNLSINNIGNDVVQSFSVKPGERKFLISFEYEKRLPLVANADIVLSFHHQLDTSNPQACCDP